MWDVRPVIAPQGMPAGVKLSRQSLASWRIGISPRCEHPGMGVERGDPPDLPAVAVVVEGLARHRDRLGPIRRAGGHREHQDFGPRGEEGAECRPGGRGRYTARGRVAADRHALAEVLERADLGEVVVAAELAVLVPRDPIEEEAALDVGGVRVASRNPRAIRRERWRAASRGLSDQVEHRRDHPAVALRTADGSPCRRRSEGAIVGAGDQWERTLLSAAVGTMAGIAEAATSATVATSARPRRRGARRPRDFETRGAIDRKNPAIRSGYAARRPSRGSGCASPSARSRVPSARPPGRRAPGDPRRRCTSPSHRGSLARGAGRAGPRLARRPGTGTEPPLHSLPARPGEALEDRHRQRLPEVAICPT